MLLTERTIGFESRRTISRSGGGRANPVIDAGGAITGVRLMADGATVQGLTVEDWRSRDFL